MRKLLLAVFAVCCMASFATAQDDDKSLEKYLSKVGSIYGENYLKPFSNSFGADLNSGWFHGDNEGGNGFNLYFGIKAFGAMIPDDDKWMPTGISYTDSVIYNGQRVEATFFVNPNSPTLFGSTGDTGSASATVNGVLGTATYTQKTIPGLAELPLVPLAMPQVTIGTIMGTDVTIRYLPTIEIGDYGSIGFWGVGVRHNVSQYLGPEFPVNIAAQVAFQGLSIKDSADFEMIKNSAFLANVQVSKSFSILTLYGGLQTEKSTLDIAYKYTNPLTSTTIPVSFSMDAKNTFRAIVGLNLGLGPININADYNMGSISVVSGGFGLSF